MNLISGDTIKSQEADYATCVCTYTHAYGHVGCVFVCVPMYNITVYYKKYLTLLFYTF